MAVYRFPSWWTQKCPRNSLTKKEICGSPPCRNEWVPELELGLSSVWGYFWPVMKTEGQEVTHCSVHPRSLLW